MGRRHRPCWALPLCAWAVLLGLRASEAQNWRKMAQGSLAANAASRRAELAKLKFTKLLAEAEASGLLGQAVMDEAADADNPKAALVELLAAAVDHEQETTATAKAAESTAAQGGAAEARAAQRAAETRVAEAEARAAEAEAHVNRWHSAALARAAEARAAEARAAEAEAEVGQLRLALESSAALTDGAAAERRRHGRTGASSGCGGTVARRVWQHGRCPRAGS